MAEESWALTMGFILNMVMLLLTFVLAPRLIRPPHRIFQPPAPDGPDLEAPPPPPPAEDPEDRKKRFKKLGGEDCTTKFSGTGIDFTAREKKFIQYIWNNCEEFWKIPNCEHNRDRRRGPQVKHFR